MQFFSDVCHDFICTARHACVDECELAVDDEITVADGVWDLVNAGDNLDGTTSLEPSSFLCFIKMTTDGNFLTYIYI